MWEPRQLKHLFSNHANSKAVGMVVRIRDINKLQKELQVDYIINRELSNLASNLVLRCGQMLAFANEALFTIKHLDLSEKNEAPEQEPA